MHTAFERRTTVFPADSLRRHKQPCTIGRACKAITQCVESQISKKSCSVGATKAPGHGKRGQSIGRVIANPSKPKSARKSLLPSLSSSVHLFYPADSEPRRHLYKLSEMSKVLPSHWPPEITFLFAQCYAPSMPPSIVSEIRGRKASLHTPPCNGRLSIRYIIAKDHPAFGQYGLFAARNIAPNSHICDYLGEVHCEDRDSDYDLSLLRSSAGVNVGVDASKKGNEARFINDYRGVQSKPNALFKEGRTPSGELRISIWSAASKIRKGDEILVSYGKSWWKARTSESKEGAPGVSH